MQPYGLDPGTLHRLRTGFCTRPNTLLTFVPNLIYPPRLTEARERRP